MLRHQLPREPQLTLIHGVGRVQMLIARGAMSSDVVRQIGEMLTGEELVQMPVGMAPAAAMMSACQTLLYETALLSERRASLLHSQ